MWRQAIIFFGLLLTGCTAVWPSGAAPVPAVPPTPDPDRLPAPPAPIPAAGTNRRTAVEEAPIGGLSMGFDAIAPIYDPEFSSAAASRLAGGELVIGAAWGGDAKAYPIAVLTRHEMVNDELAGVPILVSW